MIGNILRILDLITLAIDVGTDLGYLDVSFDGYNVSKIAGLLIGVSQGSADGKIFS